MSVGQITPPSFCIECDAAEGECAHTGARYHESYMHHPDYKPGSGQVPAELKEWFDRNEWSHEARKDPKPRSFQTISDELKAHMWLDDGIGEALEAAYRKNPLQTSYLVTEVVRSCESGTLRSPAGLLRKRLKEV